MKTIIATSNDAGRTLYKLITKYLDNVPLSRIEKLFRKKDIKVNGIRTNQKDYTIAFNDQIEIYGLIDIKKEEAPLISSFSFKKIYEDNNILIIDKPNGIEVHSSPNCLDNQVLAYLKFKQVDSFKPSHVGRLDKETSGIMLYAKNYQALKYLNDNMENIIKTYTFKSDFNEESKDVELYLYKDEDKKRMAASFTKVPYSKLSKTHFYLESNKKYATLSSGRKHQIRVSLMKLGKPIYGDFKYGGKKAGRLMLHCLQIKFQQLEGEFKYLNELEFLSQPKW
ncbi:RluA family pseudouridine synthase [Mycoplasma crocodyli]|uniref:RNA pseudouridylate synthase n=1 Tax=Mycoplasma crocodyli (strain ATCC 51981 / MP145) TaxID=512564 RepID=D5E5U4_MYCCM|nr:RluA family pseudouridine synthase [Mycoplasma crocodyli]ADE19504.1 ribosomal large subunit pseudouridylate synthase C [Mycoplasma crocodyli MP145]